MSNKKGQAAFEYMVTYSWAFVVILAAVAALTYFDAFDPQKYIPDSCEFGEQLKCVDYFIGADGTDGVVILRFRNNFQQEINITEVRGEGITTWNDTEIVDVGKITRIELNVSKEIFIDNAESFILDVDFKRNSDTASIHTITGELNSEVSDNSLGLV